VIGFATGIGFSIIGASVAFLRVTKGSSAGQVLALSGGKVVLGRHPSCQIVLDNAAVSRQHAQIIEEQGLFLVEDLRSRNGTQVNRQSIRGRTELHDGDELKVCDYAFTFMLKSTGPTISVNPDSNIIGSAGPLETIPDEFDDIGADSEPEVAATGDVENNSSFITSMSAGTREANLRLNVRPEAKLRAILEISLALGKVLNLPDILPVILKSLFKIFPQADYGFVLLKDVNSDALRVRASLSRRADDDEMHVSLTVVRQAMKSGQAILSADVVGDRRFMNSESIADMQLRSLMCTPLVCFNSAHKTSLSHLILTILISWSASAPRRVWPWKTAKCMNRWSKSESSSETCKLRRRCN
jgi:pSer/pThr/pTyr-binding forkhead associated (FHA) protein